MSRETDDADRKHEQSLRAVDPRWENPRYVPRMAMLRDDGPSLVERGSQLDCFIEPEGERRAPKTRKRTHGSE